MYALLKLAGKQFRVGKDEVVRVPYLGKEVGQSIEIKEILAVGEGADMRFGAPFVEGATVSAEILANGKDRKIRVFKKKRRKKYRRTNGHRQMYSEIKITTIA